MQKIILRNARIVNEGTIFQGDILIEGERIEKIDKLIENKAFDREIDLNGNYLIPGVIDDQVHFREPGLTHKASIFTESRSSVAGGVTSYMEMPNTKPPALTQDLLEDKYKIAKETSAANYSFFMGASNENLDEVLRTDPVNVCGVKVFMGSSTGNMLVDNKSVLENIFSNVPLLIATHCEDEHTIRENTSMYLKKYGERIPFDAHPLIRSVDACYLSSSLAVEMAQKYGTRLHVLHLTTAKELGLFRNDIPLKDKNITSEVCVHHLHFSSDDYAEQGALIKCNPAIKGPENRTALWQALLDDRLDIIATDHAPHTWQEKQQNYLEAPSGLPLEQHALVLMLEYFNDGKISIEKIVEKMCHAPAICFRIKDRGFIREGYYADLVEIQKESWKVMKSNILYKCGWSPFEGEEFTYQVNRTFVNGGLAFENKLVSRENYAKRLQFER